MGMIRPVLTNFKLGEVDPRLAGRVDLGLSIGAADEIVNAHTFEYGGIYKRGGLQYKAVIDQVAGEKYRIIPWSVDDKTDVLVILSDKKIRLYYVGSEGVNGFIEQNGGILEITSVGWNGVYYDIYKENDIYDVQYVTDKNKLYIVHNNYPPIIIMIQGTYTDGFTISYQGFNIVSGLLVTQKPKESKTSSIQFSSSTVISILKEYVNNWSLSTQSKDFVSADGLSGVLNIGGVDKNITKITITRTTQNRQAVVTPGGTIVDTTSDATTASIISNLIYAGTGYHESQEEAWFPDWGIIYSSWQSQHVDGVMNDKIPTNPSTVNFLSFCQNHFVSGQKYVIADKTSARTSYNTIGESGIVKKDVVFTPQKTKYTVDFYENTTKIASMSSEAESTLTGWFDITNYNVSINGTKSVESSANDVIDSIKPWLFTGKTYSCVPGYTLNGKEPSTIISVVENGVPSLVITNTDYTTTVISKNMTSISGQIAIRINPIITADDFPGAIAIWQGRLCIGGSKSLPNVVFMSKVNDYFDFTFFEDIEYTSTVMKPEDEWASPDVPEYETIIKKVQQTGADSAIQFMVMTDENESIQSLGGGRDLFISTTTSEFIVPAGATALNLSLQMISRNGGYRIQSRFIQDTITYVGQSRRRLFTFSQDSRIDLFNYAKHIVSDDIIQFDYRSDPDFGIYITLANGTMLYGFPNENTMAWHRYTTNGNIKSCAVIRAIDEDAVYCIVIRSGIALLERLTSINDYSFNNRPYLDSWQYYESTSPGYISSIPRGNIKLPNGSILRIHYMTGDGTEGEVGVTLSSSNIDILSIANNITKLFIGLSYNMIARTWRLDSADTEGIVKMLESIHFRLYNSSGFNLRKDEQDVFYVPVPDYQGTEQVTYSGPVRYDALSPWDVDKSIQIESENGYPVNILVIMPQFITGDNL